MKQVILVRMDLKMEKGKLSVQVAHAAVEATLASTKEAVKEWRKEGMKKVSLKVTDLREMMKYKKMAEEAGLVTALITDAGKTVFNKPTVTCLAIGPDSEKKIDSITGDLKML
ncbi:peptidyl-tRNA hydrolase [Candidatus Woesearchaeota archaeon]|nr:peptidyl-tRNA hydrolase [Candidatus Woesearchaeota archaeon]